MTRREKFYDKLKLALTTLVSEFMLLVTKPRKYWNFIKLSATRNNDRLEKICLALEKEINKLGYELKPDLEGKLQEIGSKAGVDPKTRTVYITPGVYKLAYLAMLLAHEYGHIKRGHTEIEDQEKLKQDFRTRKISKIFKYELEANMEMLDILYDLVQKL